MEKIDDIPADLPDEMFEDMLHSFVRGRQIGKSVSTAVFTKVVAGWDPSDQEIEEWVDSLHEWDADEPTDPMIPKTAHFDPEDIIIKRKKDGLCLKCGDRGEWITGALFCRDGHGKIMG